MGRHQTDNAARVVHHGAGLSLSHKAGSDKIKITIKRVIDEPGFTMQAKRLQKSILADAEADMAVRELEIFSLTFHKPEQLSNCVIQPSK